MSKIPVSDIIKEKLIKSGGSAKVKSLQGKIYEIKFNPNDKYIVCDNLPPVFTYEVFDIIINLLENQNGKAKKGNARNFKLGQKGCEETTVVGTILKNYFGKNNGESGLDPVFILSSILEWAGIVHNKRGYLELTEEYKNNKTL